MATHSRILAWEIPWTEEPGRLQSTGLERVGYNFVTKEEQQKHTYMCVCVCVCIHRERECYSAIKNEILLFVTTQMDLEDIMLSEISQTEKDKTESA